MKRRTLLTVGVGVATLLALAGGMIALVGPGRREGKLTEAGRALFAALAKAVLGDMLPIKVDAQQRALNAHLSRVEAAITGMPPSLQAEVDELVTIACSAPGRLALVGLGTDWRTASTADVTAALQGMRVSRLSLRQQAFQGLRELTNAAYFADPATWPALGYPGQRAL